MFNKNQSLLNDGIELFKEKINDTINKDRNSLNKNEEREKCIILSKLFYLLINENFMNKTCFHDKIILLENFDLSKTNGSKSQPFNFIINTAEGGFCGYFLTSKKNNITIYYNEEHDFVIEVDLILERQNKKYNEKFEISLPALNSYIKYIQNEPELTILSGNDFRDQSYESLLKQLILDTSFIISSSSTAYNVLNHAYYSLVSDSLKKFSSKVYKLIFDITLSISQLIEKEYLMYEKTIRRK